MVLMIIPEWVQKADQKLKETIRQITIQNKLDYHLVNDSKTIEDSIHAICHALQHIPQDKDMVEAEKYFKKQRGKKNESGKKSINKSKGQK